MMVIPKFYFHLINGIIDIQFDKHMSSYSACSESDSDSIPCSYYCFCNKIFKTYPGIYLHLKCKHENFFQKYKNIKIKNLFRIKVINGIRINRLEKLQEKIEKTSQQLKNYEEAIHKKIISKGRPQPPLAKIKPHVSMELLDNSTSGRKLQPQISMQNEDTKKENYIEREDRESVQSASYHFNKLQMNPYPFFNSMPIFPTPPYNPSNFMPNSIKALSQLFLEQNFKYCESYSQLQTLKNTIYDLVVYIDKNYERLNDPRANSLVLSYCDYFDFRFVGNLLNTYLVQLRQRYQLETYALQRQENELRQLDRYFYWLYMNRILGQQQYRSLKTTEKNVFKEVNSKQGERQPLIT